MNKRITVLAGCLGAALLARAPFAHADDETADAALARGRSALKAGRVHEACLAFEASEKRRPAVETELVLADCYEQDGKLMTAARLYRGLAERDPNAARGNRSAAKAAALQAKAPRLRFAINPRPAEIVIEVDGEVVPSTGDVRVDLGPHEVIATAPGLEGHASAAVDGSRAILDVIIRMEPKVEPKPEPAVQPQRAPEPAPEPAASATATARPAPMALPARGRDREPAPRGHRVRNGIALGAVGVGLVVAAAISFGVGSDKFATEHALCPSSTCASQADLDRANALLYNAQGYRAAGTAMMIGGGALALAGTYLVVTGRKHDAPRVSLGVVRGGAGVAVSGRF